MEDVLVIIIQFLFEFIFNVLLNVPFNLPSRNRTTPEPEYISGPCFILFLVGCGLAGLSLLFFSHTLIALAPLRILNLALSPVASAYLSQAIAQLQARKNKNIIPCNHFWLAFWFTLGYVAVRFAYVDRVVRFNPF